jgi:hypothetical protein
MKVNELIVVKKITKTVNSDLRFRIAGAIRLPASPQNAIFLTGGRHFVHINPLTVHLRDALSFIQSP